MYLGLRKRRDGMDRKLWSVFLGVGIAMSGCFPGVVQANGRAVVAEAFTPEMEWFKDAKFGVFIHWGIYGVDGNGASWPIFRGTVSFEDYMKQADSFTAANYDPEAWAELFKEAGARYAVLTTKHHDGMALWDTQASDLSVVKKTPAGRDLVKPFAEALRKNGLKVGFYFSWLDWSNPDYGSLGRMRSTDKGKREPTSMEQWSRFRAFNDRQLKELCGMKPDLLWFDGDWGIDEKYWGMEEMRKKLKAWLPGVVLNARMGGFGDYDTPEQGVPFAQLDSPWELCMTMGPGWGYNASLEDNPQRQIPGKYLIQLLGETVAMGGNLLLNVSPRPDGTLPDWQVGRLEEIGAWLKLNGEAVYGSRAGIHKNHYAGCSTLSKDRKTLYLFVFSKPVNGLMLKGLYNEPRKISVLGSPEIKISTRNVGGASWNKVPPTRFLNVPDELEIGLGRVLKVELSEPIDLYTGKSGKISQN
jgi:alpha-L-fucosidase